MTYSIVIVDDHLLIAKAVAAIVEGFRDFEVLYEAENGQALTERFRQPRNVPDIVLLDITMPVMDGFATAAWLKEHHPEVLVMALSVQDGEDALIRMIKHGARGYLHKNVHPAELEKALYTLVNNGMYFPDWATSKVFRTIAEPRAEAAAADAPSKREIEFLQYAATELTYREIADRMCCSPRTVESYRDSLFSKLALKTRVGLVMYAVKQGLVKV